MLFDIIILKEVYSYIYTGEKYAALHSCFKKSQRSFIVPFCIFHLFIPIAKKWEELNIFTKEI